MTLRQLVRLFRDELIPFFGGLLFFVSFLFSCALFAYSILRGWFICLTGDVDFIPSLGVLLSRLGF